MTEYKHYADGVIRNCPRSIEDILGPIEHMDADQLAAVAETLPEMVLRRGGDEAYGDEVCTYKGGSISMRAVNNGLRAIREMQRRLNEVSEK